jgi:toxin ParE1/3/4
MKLVWLPEAKEDIRRLYHFLVERNPDAASRAVVSIKQGASRLARFPELGRRMDDDTERREWYIPFGAGAYVLRYRTVETTVIVIRVWHSRESR